MCAYHCAQQSYTTQHTAVLIFFPLIGIVGFNVPLDTL